MFLQKVDTVFLVFGFKNRTGRIIQTAAVFDVFRAGFQNLPLRINERLNVVVRSAKFNIGIIARNAVAAARNVTKYRVEFSLVLGIDNGRIAREGKKFVFAHSFGVFFNQIDPVRI